MPVTALQGQQLAGPLCAAVANLCVALQPQVSQQTAAGFQEVLRRLHEAGLDSLPGGGAVGTGLALPTKRTSSYPRWREWVRVGMETTSNPQAFHRSGRGTPLAEMGSVKLRPQVPVAVFLTRFEPGGTERQMIELIRRLDPSRFRVHVACFDRAGAWLPRVAERFGGEAKNVAFVVAAALRLLDSTYPDPRPAVSIVTTSPVSGVRTPYTVRRWDPDVIDLPDAQRQ